jgi:hypothetical protein
MVGTIKVEEFLRGSAKFSAFSPPAKYSSHPDESTIPQGLIICIF